MCASEIITKNQKQPPVFMPCDIKLALVADGWELPMDDIQRLHLQLLESWPFWL
jgi:hypothetical protein